MKIKGGAEGEGEAEATEIGQTENQQQNFDGESNPVANASAATTGGSVAPNQDLQQKMSSGFGKLDALLTKTENAQMSMAHQSKQMKSFLQ